MERSVPSFHQLDPLIENDFPNHPKLINEVLSSIMKTMKSLFLIAIMCSTLWRLNAEVVADANSISPEDQLAFQQIVADNENPLSSSETKPPERLKLSAKSLVTLLQEGNLCDRCESREFILKNLSIKGDVDISGMAIKKPLKFQNVYIEGKLKARNSHLVALVMEQCEFGYIEADGMEIEHDFLITQQSQIKGGLRMPYSKVGGLLSVENSFVSAGSDSERSFNLTSSQLKGGLNLHNSILQGSLVMIQAELGKLHFEKSTIRIIPSELDSMRFAISSNWLVVTGPMTIEQCKIYGNTGLVGARIGGIFYVDATEFFGLLDDVWVMDDASIGSSLRIQRVQIHGIESKPDPSEGLRLKRTSIKGDMDLQAVSIQCNSGSKIAINADSLKCEGQLIIGNNTQVTGEIRLLAAKIEGNFEIASCSISNSNGYSLNASGLHIGQTMSISGVKTSEPVSLISAKLGNRLRLTGNLTQTIILDDAFTGHLAIEENSWPKRLSISGFRYEKITLPQFGENQEPSIAIEKNPLTREGKLKRTDSLKESSMTFLRLASHWKSRFDPQPYEQLATVMRQMGEESTSRKVLTEMSVAHARDPDSTFSEKIWYRWIGQLIGYGYNPGRPFSISVVLILVGWAVFSRARKWGLLVNKDTSQGQTGTILFQSLAYSIETFTPFFKLGLSDLWKPKPLPKQGIMLWHRCFIYFCWLYTTTGWILATLWIGALTGIAK